MTPTYPILLCPAVAGAKSVTFYLPKAEVEISIPRILANLIIRECDGTKSLDSITNMLAKRWKRSDIEAVFQILYKKGVIQDSRNISPFVYTFTENPTPWANDMTDAQIAALVLQAGEKQKGKRVRKSEVQLTTLMEQFVSERKSVRAFQQSMMSSDTLDNLLWVAYGKTTTTFLVAENPIARRTVPSAGALYPLRIDLIVWEACGAMSKGSYQVCYDAPMEVSYKQNDRFDIFKARACFVNPDALINAVCTIIVSGNVAQSAAKYGNRGFTYTLLEAAHVAQNIHLSAQARNLASLEVGGFYEQKLIELLRLPEHVEPLVTVVIGIEADQDIHSTTQQSRNIVKRVEYAWGETNGYTLPFAMAFAEMIPHGKKKSWWSCGRATSQRLAYEKAVSEAIEWYGCSHISEGTCIEATFQELGSEAIHPSVIVDYLPHQLQTGRLHAFCENVPYEWCSAHNVITGEARYVLADFVHFPFMPKNGRPYYHANSSGCAAHTSDKEAYENALLELVEREAFMVTWLNRLDRKRIAPDSMPKNMQDRLDTLQGMGYETAVTDLTLDLAPVVVVCAYKHQDRFFTCAAASEFNPVLALGRALMEAEASVYCHLRDGNWPKKIDVDKVVYPEDHGHLYQGTAHLKRALFLMGREKNTVTLEDVKQNRPTIKKLERRLQEQGMYPYVVSLPLGDCADALRHVVKRVIVPGMVPMTFGYRTESLRTKRIRSLPVLCGLQDQPTPMRKLCRFPHPFN